MEKNITKQDLEKKLQQVANAKAESLKYIGECDKGMQVLQTKKSSHLLELTKLNGEERAVKSLLSTLDPQKTEDKIAE